MNISFYPPLENVDPNNYICRMRAAILAAYPDAQINNFYPSYRLSLKSIRTTDIYWLNWFENLSTKSNRAVVGDFVLKMLWLAIMLLSGAKIVAVVHNKRPHEMRLAWLNNIFMRCLYRLAHRIMVLCDDGIEVANDLAGTDVSRKTFKVHHPTYLCTPKENAPESSCEFSVLFMGHLRPYKNVEMVIEVARKHPEMRFIVAGKIKEDSYRLQLQQLMAGVDNLMLIEKFLEDTEMNQLMERCSILILPYHLYSSLNSGVAMYAYSKGINTLIPMIGTVKELDNQADVFAYTYTTEQEHAVRLEQKLMEAYELYTHHPVEFQARINNVHREVLSRFNIEMIGKEVRCMLVEYEKNFNKR